MQQRHEHFSDLKHTLKVMRKTSDDDEVPFQLSMMFLLDEGALRFVKIPKVCQFTCNPFTFKTPEAVLIMKIVWNEFLCLLETSIIDHYNFHIVTHLCIVFMSLMSTKLPHCSPLRLSVCLFVFYNTIQNNI